MTTPELTTADGVVIRPIPLRDAVGVPLLREIWEEIKADHSAWNQDTWIGYSVPLSAYSAPSDQLDPAVKQFVRETNQVPWDCGTACCLAGHVVMSKGFTLRSASDLTAPLGDSSWVVPPEGLETFPTGIPVGDIEHVPDAATELLTLDGDQTSMLFAGSRRPYEIELALRALEADPDADLYRAIEDLDGIEAREWELANGFRDPLTGQPTYCNDEDDWVTVDDDGTVRFQAPSPYDEVWGPPSDYFYNNG
jgi:hypothetical protein